LSTLQSAAQAAVSNTIAIVDTAAADTDAQVAKRRKYNKKFTSDAETKRIYSASSVRFHVSLLF
jgi:hypothetical protein